MSEPVKVVCNSCHGGFSMSKLAAVWLAGKGVDDAVRWLAHSENGWDSSYSYYPDLARHDPLLVECVEELSERANGSFASLKVCELKGRVYRIDEYDGSETVVEPDDMKWIEVP